MINIESDKFISLAQLAAKLPSTSGNRLNPSTIFRWATTGVKGHKLEVVHVAGRMLTTWQAYLDFNAAVNAGRAPEPTPQPSPRKAKRVRNARQVLQAAGI